MNVKRWIAFILVCAAVLSLCACSKQTDDDAKQPEHVAVEAKLVSFESLEEMEEYCDVIIRGVRLAEEESRVNMANGTIIGGYTLSQLKVTQVIRDEEGLLENIEEITILENEFVDTTTNKIYHVGGYNMMVEGKEYLLFLRKSDMGYYVSAGVNFGTISLENDGRQESRMTRNGEAVSDFSYFKPIWDAAKEKYIG